MSDLENLFQQAQDALANEEDDRARTLLSRMMDADAGHPRTIELQADMALNRQEFKKAGRCFQKLLEFPDAETKGSGHYGLAIVKLSEDKFESALGELDLAIQCLEAANAHEFLLTALSTAAHASVQISDYHTATAYLEQAMATLGKVDLEDSQTYAEADVHHRLGENYRLLGDYANAEFHFDEALARYDHLEEAAGLADVLDSMGIMLQTQARYEEADELHLQAAKINEDIENDQGLIGNFINLSVLNTHCGNYDRAAEFAGHYLELCEAIGNDNGIAHYHLMMGEIERRRGDLGRAEELLLESQKLYRRCGDPSDKMCAISELAIVYRLQGKNELAETNSLEALQIAEKLDHKYGIAHILDDLAQVCIAQGRNNEARNFWTRSLTVFREMENEKMIAEIQRNLATIR
ncbi:MAG: tetratricopeptide repeat protein [Planctomycetaceae bacterium]|nr:tetratricopeptide repeat protein [Planctomycetaceae bacterium]